jgi:hypothetical protein
MKSAIARAEPRLKLPAQRVARVVKVLAVEFIATAQ